MTGLPFSPNGFISEEYIENNETLNIGISPYKNAKRVILYDTNGNPVGVLGTAPVAGQLVIAVTGTRIQLPSAALSNGVILSANSANTAALTIGSSTVTNTVNGSGNGVILGAGASISTAVDNTNRIYCNGTSGDILSWLGS